MFILNTGLFTEVCPQKNERESLHSTPPQTEQQHIQCSGMTDLKNQFVRDCSFLERLFQLLHAKALRSFRTAFSSQFVLRWSLQARRTSTNGYRKTGGFTEPQVHRVDEAVFPSVPVQVLLFQMPSRFKAYSRVHRLSKPLRYCPAGKELGLGTGGNWSHFTPVAVQ